MHAFEQTFENKQTHSTMPVWQNTKSIFLIVCGKKISSEKKRWTIKEQHTIKLFKNLVVHLDYWSFGTSHIPISDNRYAIWNRINAQQCMVYSSVITLTITRLKTKKSVNENSFNLNFVGYWIWNKFCHGLRDVAGIREYEKKKRRKYHNIALDRQRNWKCCIFKFIYHGFLYVLFIGDSAQLNGWGHDVPQSAEQPLNQCHCISLFIEHI